MAKQTGTYDIGSLFAAVNQSVAQYGQERIVETIQQDNANFSAQVTDALSDISADTKQQQVAIGTSIGGDMMEQDEYGQGPTQRDQPGYLIGIPLRRFQFPIGWTTQWRKNAMAADFAVKNAAAQGADLRRTRYQMQRAIYNPTNYTFVDRLVNKVSLSVKAFINADSTAIPNGPNGEVFDGTTHTHYDANATLTATVAAAQIQDVLEHRNGATVRVAINTADAAAYSALTGFIPLQVPVVTINQAANQIASPRLDITKTDNRQIGWFSGAEIWTKPWAVANYSVAYDTSAPNKPLARRVETTDLGLHIAAEINSEPLHANFAEHFYGFGAWNRFALHVLRFNNGTYAAPTLTY